MSTLLKHLMGALDENSKKTLFNEISDLFKAKSGLDYGLSISDILNEVKPGEKTPEEMKEEQTLSKFKEELAKFSEDSYQGKKDLGYNIQEM